MNRSDRILWRNRRRLKGEVEGKFFFYADGDQRRPMATDGDQQLVKRIERVEERKMSLVECQKRKNPTIPAPCLLFNRQNWKVSDWSSFFFFLKKFPALNNGTASLRPWVRPLADFRTSASATARKLNIGRAQVEGSLLHYLGNVSQFRKRRPFSHRF